MNRYIVFAFDWNQQCKGHQQIKGIYSDLYDAEQNAKSLLKTTLNDGPCLYDRVEVYNIQEQKVVIDLG